MPDFLPPIPTRLSVMFVALVLAVVATIYLGMLLNARRLGFPRSGARYLSSDVLLGTVVWLGVIGELARRGLFLNFDAVPPRFAFAVVPSIIAIVVIVSRPRTREFLSSIPLSWLTGFQSFRIAVELMLWQLAAAGIAPRLITFEGRNFDILIGVTAPLMAWFLAKRPTANVKRIARWWNLIGLLLLLNVVVHGILAAPTAFQVFDVEPANTLVARFPFIWLPTFLVPIAAIAHLISLGVLSARD